MHAEHIHRIFMCNVCPGLGRRSVEEESTAARWSLSEHIFNFHGTQARRARARFGTAHNILPHAHTAERKAISNQQTGYTIPQADNAPYSMRKHTLTRPHKLTRVRNRLNRKLKMCARARANTPDARKCQPPTPAARRLMSRNAFSVYRAHVRARRIRCSFFMNH